MRHFPFRPSRRSKTKVKVAPRPQPTNWLGGAYSVLLALMSATIAAQLVVTSLAAMPGVATVGDRVPMGRAPHPFVTSFPVISAAEIATPQATTGRACRLDLQKMLNPGGVFTVLAVRPDGVVLSWAGGPTSAGAAGCARSAPIIVSAGDYGTLLKTQTAKH